MKRYSFLLLALAFTLFSCKEKSPEKGNSEVVEGADPAVERPTADAPILGAWLNKDYYAKLKESKSPYAAAQVSSHLSELVVKPDAAVVVYANSEGESLEYHFEGDVLGNRFRLSSGTAFAVDDNGLLRSSDDKSDVFVKIAEQAGEVSVFEYCVRTSLIAGSYSGAPSEVRFDVSGEVIGFGEYMAYRIITRFDDLSDFDLMEFKTLSGETQFMAWKIDGDDLVLHDVVEGSDYVYAPGKELYRLTLVSALG